MDFYESLLNPAQPQQEQTSYPMQQPMQGQMGYPIQDYSMQGQMGYPMQDYSMQGQMGYPMQDYSMQQPMQNQMGYPMQDYSMQSQMGYPRMNKTMIIQELQNYVVMSTQKPISKVVKLEDIESKFRHACAEVGDVSYLDVNYFPVPQLGINIAFYFCLACGSLYVQKDFM